MPGFMPDMAIYANNPTLTATNKTKLMSFKNWFYLKNHQKLHHTEIN